MIDSCLFPNILITMKFDKIFSSYFHFTNYSVNGTSIKIIEPRHEISNYVVCATSKCSDQLAHMHRLSRGFASHLNII